MEVLYNCSEGLPILFDAEKEEISYKDTVIDVNKLIDAFNSGADRVKLTSNLTYTNHNETVEFGCLTISSNHFRRLIKTTKQLIQNFKRDGR